MSNTFTSDQIDIAFDQIVTKAYDASRICNEVIESYSPGDIPTQAALVAGIKALIDQIGWIADNHGELKHKGNAFDWMMPASYIEAGAKIGGEEP